MLNRILTAVIGIPAVIAVLWQGGILFLTALSIAVIIALREMEVLLSKNNITTFSYLNFIFGIILMVHAYYLGSKYLSEFILAYILCLSLFILIKKLNLNSVVFTIFSVFYIPFLMRYFVLLRMQQDGFLLLLIIFILTWASDTGAFFTGKKLGKRKLSPTISPKKTIEGALGGIVLTSVVSVFLISYYLNLSLVLAAALGILISISSQIGDLFESFLKRKMEVKDSGALLPGHGGILDRIDSLLFSVPVFYSLLKLFIF